MTSLADLKFKIKRKLDEFQTAHPSVGAVKQAASSWSEGVRDFGAGLGQSAAAVWNAQRQAKEADRAIAESNKTLQTAKMLRENGQADRAATLTRSQGTRLGDLSLRIGKDAAAMPTATEMRNKLVSGGLRTALTIAGSTAPLKSVATNAVVGGVLEVALGDKKQSAWERFGKGAGSSVKYAGINRITGPTIERATKTAGLIPTIITKAGANLAEDMSYARLAENRNLSPSEALLSVALPTVTEVGGEAVKKVRLSRELANSRVSTDGYVRNRAGQLYNPETHRYVLESSPEALKVKSAQQKYIKLVGGGEVGEKQIGKIKLKKTGPNNWVDSRYTDQFKSDIQTPEMKVVYAKTGKIKLANGKLKIKSSIPKIQAEGKMEGVSEVNIDPTEAKKIKLKIARGEQALRQGGWGNNTYSNEELDMIRLPVNEFRAKLGLPPTEVQTPIQRRMIKLKSSNVEAKPGSYGMAAANVEPTPETLSKIEARNATLDAKNAEVKPPTPPSLSSVLDRVTSMMQKNTDLLAGGVKPTYDANGRMVAAVSIDSPVTTAKIAEEGNTAAQRADDYDYEQWQKSVFGKTGTRTTGEAIDTLTSAVKSETNAAASGLDFADDWKGKNRLSFARETMTRNFEDVMGKDAPAMKQKYLEPIAKSEAERTRWLNNERDQIKALGIKPRSNDSALVQQFGEGDINEVELRTKTDNPDGVIKAANFLRQKYDGYIQQLNTTLVRNGYEPVPFRKDYFHHFNDLTLNLEVLGPWKKIGEAMKAEELPTDINGLTADFRPGKQFFNALLQRKGEVATPDAIQGIDKYLEGASNQIFHTDNIKRLRSLEDELRLKYAGDDHLTNFAADLGEFTNNLAGKKAMFDRGFESWFGRPVYTVLNAIKSQVGANMVGGNIASALTNYIPLTQTLATTSKGAVVRAMGDTLKNVARDDGFVNSSDFLTRRLGSDKLTTTKWEDLGKKAGWIFQAVDKFTSQVVVRSKYLEGIDKGLNEVEAMRSANDWAARLMADRSKGAVPTMFNSKSMGALTQFQLEVNNQLSFIAKDIPRNSETWQKAASQIAQLFLYGYLFNNLTQSITGRRPALDPIGVTQQAYEDFTNPDMKDGKALTNLVGNVSDQLPFTSIVTGGGRIPMTAAIPDIPKLITGDTTWGKEAKKLGYLLPPFGGGQAMKTYDGLKAYLQGYSETPSGAVRFPVPQTPINAVKTGLFGQWSTPEAQKYLREGQTPMGDNQSELIKQSDDKIGLFNTIKKVSASESSDDKIKAQVKKDGSSQFTDAKLFWYNQESGETNTINYGKYLTPPPTDPVQRARWEQDKFSAAVKMYKAEGIDPTAKQDTFNKLGINETDLAYFDIASDDVNIKRVFVGEYLNTLDPSKNKMTALAELRRTVKSQAILSDNVITAMVKNGELTAQEGKALKRIDWDEKTNEPKISKSGSGKISIQSVKFTPTQVAAPARMAIPQISMGTGSRIKLMEPGQSSTRKMIKLKKLPTSKIKIKSTYYQGAQK